MPVALFDIGLSALPTRLDGLARELHDRRADGSGLKICFSQAQT